MQKQIAFGMALALALNGLTSRSVAAGCSVANLMTLNVNVTDQEGNAIPGLKWNDFSVSEDGKMQKIVYLAFQGPNLDSTPSAGQGPFRYVNHRLITFLFNFTLTPERERTRIQDDVIEFIQNNLKPGELLSIETVTAGSVETTQDFTDDRIALLAAVNKFRAPGNRSADHIVDANPSGLDPLRAEEMFAGISTACQRQPFATKKTLLYVGTSVNQSGGEPVSALDAAAKACKKLDVAIYPIGGASAGVAELTARTGGQIFSGLGPAIEGARRETGDYYVLGYYSTNSRNDGVYRNVELKLAPLGLMQAKLRYSYTYLPETELPEPPQSPPRPCF